MDGESFPARKGRKRWAILPRRADVLREVHCFPLEMSTATSGNQVEAECRYQELRGMEELIFVIDSRIQVPQNNLTPDSYYSRFQSPNKEENGFSKA